MKRRNWADLDVTALPSTLARCALALLVALAVVGAVVLGQAPVGGFPVHTGRGEEFLGERNTVKLKAGKGETLEHLMELTGLVGVVTREQLERLIQQKNPGQDLRRIQEGTELEIPIDVPVSGM